MKALSLKQEGWSYPDWIEWLRPPQEVWRHLTLIIPLALSQVLQRLYHIIDNRYLNYLGSDALLIHNIQYNFIILGQALGAATATSCLVFWRRKEAAGSQGSILLKHLVFSVGISVFCAALLFPFSGKILEHFNIPSPYTALASLYLWFGLINMVLQAAYGSLDGMLIASGQQKRSMVFAGLLALGNWVFDSAAVYLLFDPNLPSANALQLPLLVVGGSTTFLLLAMITAAFTSVKAKADGWHSFSLRTIFEVWWAEAGLGLVRSVTPFIYAYQLGMISATKGFLVTYQLALHVSYIFCLPFLAGAQLAVRDASHAVSEKIGASQNLPPPWWASLLFTALLPTLALLIVGAIFPASLLHFFYGYSVPGEHEPFLPIFYLACIIGQIGNSLFIPLRARKRNSLVTRNMLLVEFGILLGGTELLILWGKASPATICWVTLAYTTGHLLLNVLTLRGVIRREENRTLGVA